MDKTYRKKLQEELKQYNVHLRHLIIKTDNYYMREYQKCLRYSEYYHHKLDAMGGGKTYTDICSICLLV